MFMLLGVVFHAALMYRDMDWVFRDGQTEQVFVHLADALHIFRMPAFFWIAGYFCATALLRNTLWNFAKRRFWRLAVPLIVLWPTLNFAQDWLVATNRGETGWGVLTQGIGIHHLWFINNLLLYSLLAVLLLPSLRWLQSRSFVRLQAMTWWTAVGLSAIVSFAAWAAVRALQPDYMRSGYFGTPAEAFFYGSCFFLGLISAALPSFHRALMSCHPAWAPIAVTAAVWLNSFVYSHELFWVRELSLLLKLGCVWLAVGATIRLSVALLRRAPRLTSHLAASSYTVYLAHLVLVVGFGVWFSHFNWCAVPKFFLVCLLSVSVSVAVHFLLVRRYRFFRVIFGGGPR
jgi:glucan biosynthesis protein C